MQGPFILVYKLPPLLLKIFNENALFCDDTDDTDDFNFYKYISNLNYIYTSLPLFPSG